LLSVRAMPEKLSQYLHLRFPFTICRDLSLPLGMTEVGTELDRHFARIAAACFIIVAGGAVKFMSAKRCFNVPRWRRSNGPARVKI
jgi:hypothetical protein